MLWFGVMSVCLSWLKHIEWKCRHSGGVIQMLTAGANTMADHCLRHRSAAARLLGLRVRIPPLACLVEASVTRGPFVQRNPTECACVSFSGMRWNSNLVHRSMQVARDSTETSVYLFVQGALDLPYCDRNHVPWKYCFICHQPSVESDNEHTLTRAHTHTHTHTPMAQQPVTSER
jgi:hypothetical protein